MPYTADKPGSTPTAEELRARVPGWGADLAGADRPAFPREQPGIETGAHWDMPEDQPRSGPREKSVEHERLTPVFGTAQPLHGLAGAVKRYAYDKYSEGQTAHWLLLILGDRIDSTTAHARSLFSRRPDDPLTQSGILGERGHRPFSSRFGRGRADLKHMWLDPLLVFGPWVVTAVTGFVVARWLVRAVAGAIGRVRRGPEP
ncbi:hypothetical protein JNB63_17140 [Microbacterium trichothecenolyticum]|uniref:hypothetical protein n=1 Tax=Microbacterium trichothecenolyticum TaxID=69370 RepID=UPI001C6E8EFA|nr:hypothetical protein [Microbacterium trichothecenolyticum]MBW9121825.1 hypothetical protein [Microbacterium trichothecenolyticum]